MDSLLPPNSSRLEQALEKVLINNIELENKIADIYDINEVDKDFLSYLAWAMGVEIWSKDIKPEDKRKLVQDFLTIRAMRGTKAAIEKAYDLIGLEAEIIENPIGDLPDGSKGPLPYYFKLKIKGVNISNKFRAEIMRLTDLLKPIRSKYFFDISYSFDGGMHIGVIGRITNIFRKKAELKKV